MIFKSRVPHFDDKILSKKAQWLQEVNSHHIVTEKQPLFLDLIKIFTRRQQHSSSSSVESCFCWRRSCIKKIHCVTSEVPCCRNSALAMHLTWQVCCSNAQGYILGGRINTTAWRHYLMTSRPIQSIKSWSHPITHTFWTIGSNENFLGTPFFSRYCIVVVVIANTSE